MSADLVAFLRARLDEDEAAAEPLRTAWTVAPAPHVQKYEDRFTPQRQLREIEAKRTILARHQPYPLDRWQLCNACCSVEHFEFMGPELSAVRWPCPDVRALAAIYAGHADYDPDWKP